MLKQEILKRDLPPLLTLNDGTPCTAELWRARRSEIMDTLQDYIYGYTPKPPKRVVGEVIEQAHISAFAGKVVQQRIVIKFDTPNGEFAFPMSLFLPRNDSSSPLFLHISFRPDIPDIYCPIEEIIDNGFGLAIFCYKDIVNDNLHGDFTDGLGKLFINTRCRRIEEWGKIGIWAYAASRTMDYLLTRDEIDNNHIAVIGHSRLGKTALWCAAQDERFFMGISNGSGTGGAGLVKGTSGELISAFVKYGSWDWFCERFKEYEGREDVLPCDQHFLLAAIAPRYVCVGSAEFEGSPESEFLACMVASEAYKLLGPNGIVTADEYPSQGTSLHAGRIGYHIRPGYHYFCRDDWHQYMKFMREKINERKT